MIKVILNSPKFKVDVYDDIAKKWTLKFYSNVKIVIVVVYLKAFYWVMGSTQP